MAEKAMVNGTSALRVITIEANEQPQAIKLRIAAYCRVSTDDEEQLTSYEAQRTAYIDKIMGNPDWTMAGIFADEGITGTSARKRPEFLRMIRQCRQKKIDLILTKSISRFARNTVDCLTYVRLLKEHGIGVFFEEQNINTLETDSEMLLTLLGAFAQAESESISANVRWGIRQAMREGKANICYKYLYAYEKGEDGRPRIIPDQAEVVKSIYDRFLAGASLRQIKEWLESEGIPNVAGKEEWTISAIRGILTSEKYCGDVILQKTFISDCISKKSVKNTGQLPKYLIESHHPAIVDRKTFDAVQTELARRKAAQSPTKAAPTGLTSYASKYALSERLVCGECGTLYRRCTWKKGDRIRIVWRCVSRLDYGKRYCHSPTLDEEPLQRAILAAVNKAMGQKEDIIWRVARAMEKELPPIPGEEMSLAGIEKRLGEIDQEVGTLIAQAAKEGEATTCQNRLKDLLEETTTLKERRTFLQEQREKDSATARRMKAVVEAMEETLAELTEWEESTIRQLVDTVKILSKDRILVCLRCGVQIEQEIE